MPATAAASTPAQALVRSHRAFLAFVRRHVADPAAAEDILQSAFVRSLERADQLRDDDSIVAWFYRTLRNAVIDHHRRSDAATRGLAGLANTEALQANAEPMPDDHATLCACLGELAATLRAPEAEAIRRVDLEGTAVKDYAAELGITANNAGVRLFRARANLRRAVTQCCGTCAEHGCTDCSCEKPATT